MGWAAAATSSPNLATAAYRRRALAVLARRSFTWAWDAYRRTGWT